MKLADFDYHLPPRRIAQHPLPRRDLSRLLVLHRSSRSWEETRFRDLPRFLRVGDLVVLNDTKVKPLRLLGKKPSGGRAEVTLVRRLPEGEWECLVRTRKPRPGMRLLFGEDLAAELAGESEGEVRVSAEQGAPLWRLRFLSGEVEEALTRHGLPPLPPYLKRTPGENPESDRRRYQTVYAREGEAAAAPTAGLHFSPRLLESLVSRGIELARLRLDVSYGTFAPVRTAEIEEHRMVPEYFVLPAETAAAVKAARARGGRVVAVGTTVTRVLEHAAGEGWRPGGGWTSLYIYPGFSFQAVDALITNFHMPRSTLLLLVSAFAERELVLAAYRFALRRGYRFLSYGDAMLIL